MESGDLRAFQALAGSTDRSEGANGAWASAWLDKAAYDATRLGEFFSKAWSTDFFKHWMENHPDDHEAFGHPAGSVGTVYRDWESAKRALEASFASATAPRLLAKAPWGTSGAQNKRVLDPAEIGSELADGSGV